MTESEKNEQYDFMEKYDGDQSVPAEVKRWNWGAFWFNIYWGFGNRTYLPLLCLIPVFNIVWVFVCGFKGNAWAWQNGNYRKADLEHFLQLQHTWSRAGIFAFIFQVVLGIVLYAIYAVVLVAVFSQLGK